MTTPEKSGDRTFEKVAPHAEKAGHYFRYRILAQRARALDIIHAVRLAKP